MKNNLWAKVQKPVHRDFLGAHRYTISDGMCALRGPLHGAVALLRKSKGETTFPLRCRGRTYPLVYFASDETPKSGASSSTKSADFVNYTISVNHHTPMRARCCYGC